MQKQLFLFLSILINSYLGFSQNNFSLQKTLQTARENNPVLKTEILNIGIIQSDLITAKLRPNPKLNNQSLQLMNTNLYPASTNWSGAKNRQVWWQVTKVFQLPSQIHYKIDVANQRISLAEKQYKENERTVFVEVASKWLEIWNAQKKLDILQIANANIDTLTKINQLKFKNQVITQTELFRTELLSKQYDLQLKTAKQEVNNRLKELRFLIGVQDSLSIDKEDNFLFSIPTNLDSLLSESIKERTDIQVSKSIIEVSNSNIGLQKAMVFPQPELGFIWNPQNSIPYFGVFATVELPVFSRNQGEIKKAYAQKEQAEIRLSTIENKLKTEIQVAFSNYKTNEQNVENYKPVIEQSQLILDNVKYAYLKGGTTIIDFLEAQRSWLETQQNYYNTLFEYKKGYIQLLYTTGLINKLAQ